MSDIGRYDFMNDVISVTTAAEILGLTARQVTRMLESGEIVGKLLGRQWAVSRASVEAMKQARAAAPQPQRKRTRRTRV